MAYMGLYLHLGFSEFLWVIMESDSDIMCYYFVACQKADLVV